jgi:hypothetical protein
MSTASAPARARLLWAPRAPEIETMSAGCRLCVRLGRRREGREEGCGGGGGWRQSDCLCSASEHVGRV